MLRPLLFCSLQMASALLMSSAARAIAPPRVASVQMLWHVFPRDGAAGLLTTEYFVERGKQQPLGCYDMGQQRQDIPPDQCIVQAADDGSCIYVYARGFQPTGWRTSPNEPWTWMQPGESVTLGNGHKVSLDCNDPEGAVFKFEKANPQQGGYGQQQGGYGQPQGGGYGQPQGGGYGQPQGGGYGPPQGGGYGQPQGGGYGQQGGY